MRVSVVIISYNASALLHCALLALNHQRLAAGESFEVVVVDDGSTDDTPAMLARERFGYPLAVVRLTRDAGSSRSRARNAGAAAAQGDVLVFLDGDEIAAPDFVAHHLRRHRLQDDLVVLGMRSHLSPGTIGPQALRDGFDLARLPPVEAEDSRLRVLARYSQNPREHLSAWYLCYSCNISMPATLFRQVGGFDEAFRGWGLEDCELGYRLAQAGAAFAFNCQANCFDPWQERQAISQEKFEQWQANLALFKQKHPAAEVAGLDHFIEVFRPPFQRHWLEAHFAFEDDIRQRAPRERHFSDALVVRLKRDPAEAELQRLLDDQRDAMLVLLDEPGAVETEMLVQRLASRPGVLYWSSSERTRALPSLATVMRQATLAGNRLANNGDSLRYREWA